MKKYFIMMLILFLYSYSAAQYVHVDGSGTGNRTQGTGWADAIPLDTLSVVTFVPPIVVFIRGNCTVTRNIDLSASDGTAINPISIIGVLGSTTHEGSSVVASDYSVITDTASMPYCNFQTYTLTLGDNYNTRGIKLTSSGANAITTGAENNIQECIIYNNYNSTAGRYCLLVNNYTTINNCIFTAKKGASYGINIFGASIYIENCYFYDFTDATKGKAILISSTRSVITKCAFKNCIVGIDVGTQDYTKVSYCSFYGNANDIMATDAYSVHVSNCWSYNCTGKFATWTTQTNKNIFYNNHVESRINDFSLVDTSSNWRDIHLTDGDPLIDSVSLRVNDTLSELFCRPFAEAPAPILQ